MKNVLKFGLVAFIAGSIVFSACKKDEKPAAEILQNGSWKISKSEGKLSTETVWVADTIEACTADDFITYTSATASTFDEGATKCFPSDPQTSPGTYTLSADGKTMVENGIAYASEISSSKIVLTATNILGFGQDIRVTMVPK